MAGKNKMYSFEEARKIARALKIKSKVDWRNYFRSDERDPRMPVAPNAQYKDAGFVSVSDFFGPSFSQMKVFLPFEEARAYARSLNFKNINSWVAHTHSGALPSNIPKAPFSVYKDQFEGMPNWLGYENKISSSRKKALREVVD